MKKLTPWFLLLALCCFGMTAFAAESDQLPANFLHGTHVQHANTAPHGHRGVSPTPHGFPLGVDTISNFTGHFQAQGFGPSGAPQQTWNYSMVGSDPSHGGTTTYNAPVVPVNIDLRNTNGTPRYVTDDGSDPVASCNTPATPGPQCHRLFYDATQFVGPYLASPIFQNASYSSSSVPTQFTDAIAKAEFGNQAKPNWHTLLAPSLKTARTMVLIRGTYRFGLNPDFSLAFVLVDINTFNFEFFPENTPGTPLDTSSVIGASEAAGDVTTKDISTFLFPNTYLYFNGDPSQCCVLGYHSFDFELNTANNNQPQFYVLNYSSWITPGLLNGGLADVSGNSHEMSELFNDPFVGVAGRNDTPWWISPNGLCQDNLETGDVIENLPNGIFPITMSNGTYHVQNEALLPWFALQKNSTAIDNAYSYPNESVLTSAPLSQPFNCGLQ